MRFSILASGSSGNAIYVEAGSTRILLDAGISGKQLDTRLQTAAQVSLAELDAILVTHEHIDHVRGLPQAIKKSHAHVYLSAGTRDAVAADLPLDQQQPERIHTIKAHVPFTLGPVTVTPFAISHDAEEPVAYRFDADGTSLTVLTDLGYVSDTIKAVVLGSQCIVLETNHDPSMLRAGRYPWSVKRRILGDKGHLSNEDAGVALAEMLATDTAEIYMAHLSEENNQPDLAEITVASVLREIDARYLEQVTLHRTSRHFATPLHQM